MLKQKMIAVTLGLLLMTGCVCTDPPEADLLRENRKHLTESIRPALEEAMDKATKPNGKPAYIDAYKQEKLNLLDRIISESARVAPDKE